MICCPAPGRPSSCALGTFSPDNKSWGCCCRNSRPTVINPLTHWGRDKMPPFADDIFKCIFLNENVWIPIKNSLKFVPKGPINNIPTLVQIMAWRCSGDKPLSEPMMVSLPTHICVTRPQWVKQKLSNYTLHKAGYDGFCAETIQTMMRFDRKRKWHRYCSWVSPKLCELLGEKYVDHFSNNADISITDIIEIQNLIS